MGKYRPACRIIQMGIRLMDLFKVSKYALAITKAYRSLALVATTWMEL